MQKKGFGALAGRLLHLMFERSLGFIALYSVMTAFFVPVMSTAQLFLPTPLYFAAFFVLMLSGCLLQSLWCRLRHYRRPEDTLSYEANVRYFRMRLALPVMALAVAAGFAAMKPARAYLIHLSETHEYYYYDDASFIPFLFCLFVAAAIAAGSFVWFFPSERITTGRSAVACLILLAAASFFSLNSGHSVSLALCVTLFSCCWLYGMNRMALRRTRLNATAGGVPANVEVFNFCVTSFLLLITLVLGAVLYISLSGLITLGSLLLAVLMAAGAGSDGFTEPQELADAVNQSVYGNSTPAASPRFWFLLFFLLLAMVLLLIAVFRRSSPVQTLFRKIRELLHRLMEFLLDPIKFFLDFKSFAEEEENPYYNFIDEEERLHQHAVIGSKSVTSASDYRDFVNAYKTRKTARDRLRFAYATYIALERNEHRGLKLSDTPRETARKLSERESKKDRIRELDAITAEFERTEFADGTPDETTERAATALVHRIRAGMHG